MKVTHCIPSFFPATVYGGPIYSVLGLCRALIKQGVSLTVLTTNANGQKRLTTEEQSVCEKMGLTVNYSPYWYNVNLSPHLYLGMIDGIRNTDVVHITSTYSLATLWGMLLARHFRKPVVFSPRGGLQRFPGSSNQLPKRLFEALLRCVWSKDWYLHVTAENELEASVERLAAKNVCVIPNGVDPPDVVTPCPVDTTLRLLFIGRLHVKKGLENLFTALSRMNGTEYQLRVVGTGTPEYEQKLVALTNSLKIADRVEFLGHLDGLDREKAFEWSQCVVMPSHVENFGMVVVEALARGRPVIASHGSPWSILETSGCGLWVDNRPEELLAAVASLSTRDLQDMGSRGRRLVVTKFTWDACASLMTQKYSEMCGSPTTSSCNSVPC